MAPVITLTTDFGLKDPYVAEVKAVILSISPDVVLVDITHEVEKFNTRMGAYILASASPYFLKGTIHVTIVDPGVGTKRQPILIQTQHAYFIGPDNGVMTLAAKKEETIQVRKIVNPRLMMPETASTFHGRDIFAPAAAYLANGSPPEEFGPKLSKIETPAFAEVVRRNDMLVGEIIHIDDFGNVITNFAEKEVADFKDENAIGVKLKNDGLKLKFCKTYGDVGFGKPLALIGSHGFLEIALNQGNAAEKFKLKNGDRISICLRSARKSDTWAT
jgi:S-adenosylmethionine hydrolase